MEIYVLVILCIMVLVMVVAFSQTVANKGVFTATMLVLSLLLAIVFQSIDLASDDVQSPMEGEQSNAQLDI